MYNRSELTAMAHSRVKKLAIAKAKQRGEKSSWIQTTPKDKLVDYIIDGNKPKDGVPVPTPTPTPSPSPSPQPASTGSLEDMLADKVAEKLGDDIYSRTERYRETLSRLSANRPTNCRRK